MNQLEARLPRPWLLLLVIAAVSILPFAAALGGSFIYDDFHLVLGNELVRELRIVELWTSEFFHNAKALHFQYFRPLVTTSWALDWALFNGHPGGLHATNLAIHGIVASLVFLTLRRWSGRDEAALLATLLWAWHPTKTEAVVWISGRTDLLCTLGLLIATMGAARRFRGARFGLPVEIFGALIAFTAKESAVVLPGIIAVEAWVAQNRPPLEPRVFGRAILKALPHGGVVAAYLVGRVFFLPIEPKDFAHEQRLLDTALFALETWGETAKSLFFPWPLTMHRAPLYVDEAKNYLHDPLRIGLGVLVVLVLIGATLSFAKKRPMLVAGLLLAAFLFLPVANLRPTRMPVLTAERFAYLPSLGLALALIGVLPRRRDRLGQLAWGGVGLALIGGITASALHTEDLLDERSFWAHELSVHPNLPSAARPAFHEAFANRRFDEALDLAGRGYRGGKMWTIGHPFDVEFALYGAQVVEAMTLDSDAASLAKLADFYRTFFLEKERAELETSVQLFTAHGGRLPAAWLRDISPGRFAGFQAMAGRVFARVGDCERALLLARAARDHFDEPSSKTTTALVLARCDAWDEAIEMAQKLPEGPPRAELEANLRASREALEQVGDASDIDAALLRSRVAAMLLDRKGAYGALSVHEDELVAHPQGALYLARAAWAAGEDEVARRALLRWMPKEEREEMLAGWAKELGRGL